MNVHRAAPRSNGTPGNQQILLPNVSNVTSLAISSARSFASNHKIVTCSYLYGLTCLLLLGLLGSGTQLSLQQQRQYERIMSSVDVVAEYQASNRYRAAMDEYSFRKGWFSCDAACQRAKSNMLQAKHDWEAVRAEGQATMSNAKKVAGLWSEVGVGEVKDSFWEYFHAGKQFAKRQSMWDAMFMGMRSMSRDESMLEYCFKMLIQVLINFSLGLVMALVIFVFGLWSIVKSYQPSPLVALFFFVSASCTAFAFVSTYIMAICGAAAGGVYGMVKLAESNLRIEQDRARNGGRYVQGGRLHPGSGRPHYQ